MIILPLLENLNCISLFVECPVGFSCHFIRQIGNEQGPDLIKIFRRLIVPEKLENLQLNVI